MYKSVKEIQELIEQTKDRKFIKNKFSDKQINGYDKTLYKREKNSEWRKKLKSNHSTKKYGKNVIVDKILKTKKEKGLIRDMDFYDEIYQKVWGPDRGNALYKELAKEYNVLFSCIKDIASGRYHDDLQTQKLEEWNKKYAWVKIVEADGTEHIFDRMWDARVWFKEKFNNNTIPDLTKRFDKGEIKSKSSPYYGMKFIRGGQKRIQEKKP